MLAHIQRTAYLSRGCGRGGSGGVCAAGDCSGGGGAGIDVAIWTGISKEISCKNVVWI